jgi:hypothetical protein
MPPVTPANPNVPGRNLPVSETTPVVPETKLCVAPPEPPMTRLQILAFPDREAFPVDVPWWKNRICMVRELDMGTMRTISDSCRDADGKIIDADYAALVVIEGSVDPKFLPEDFEVLKNVKSNRAVTRLFNAIIDGKKN